ncbi:MAG TPA: hypothetical protein VGT41_05995 [Candidatus Babeliales bacterium]|nr:hypothetical protein [Candidatus Babeliales bacterium]
MVTIKTQQNLEEPGRRAYRLVQDNDCGFQAVLANGRVPANGRVYDVGPGLNMGNIDPDARVFAMSPDKQYLAFAAGDVVGGRFSNIDEIHVWDLKTGNEIYHDKLQDNASAQDIESMQIDGYVLTAVVVRCRVHYLSRWDLRTGTRMSSEPNNQGRRLGVSELPHGYGDIITSVDGLSEARLIEHCNKGGQGAEIDILEHNDVRRHRFYFKDRNFFPADMDISGGMVSEDIYVSPDGSLVVTNAWAKTAEEKDSKSCYLWRPVAKLSIKSNTACDVQVCDSSSCESGQFCENQAKIDGWQMITTAIDVAAFPRPTIDRMLEVFDQLELSRDDEVECIADKGEREECLAGIRSQQERYFDQIKKLFNKGIEQAQYGEDMSWQQNLGI